jgi:hypothetical protein
MDVRKRTFETYGVYPANAREHAHYQQVFEQQDREAARLAAQKQRWAVEEAAERRAAEARKVTAQRAANDQLEAELRSQFFAANPAASEADFKRLLPQMRDQTLLSRAEAGRNREVDALVARYGSTF